MPALSLDAADALLFDLGNVIIEVDFDRAFARWAAHSQQPFDTIKAKLSEELHQFAFNTIHTITVTQIKKRESEQCLPFTQPLLRAKQMSNNR